MATLAVPVQITTAANVSANVFKDVLDGLRLSDDDGRFMPTQHYDALLHITGDDKPIMPMGKNVMWRPNESKPLMGLLPGSSANLCNVAAGELCNNNHPSFIQV